MTATQYAYKVKDARGRLIEGRVEADTENAVADKLRSMGYRPLEIRVANAGLDREFKFRGKQKIKLKDLAIFSRQFATMINSGLSMLRTLTILSEQSENNVEAGSSISAAFMKHPGAFPPLMVNMIKAGETGGFLDVSMRQIAEALESEVKLRGKIKAAMTYPVVVLCLAVVMVIGMLLFVVPTFKNMFESLGGNLPLPTQVLVTLSGWMKFLAPLMVVMTVGFLAWWRKYGKTERVRNIVDPAKLKAPVFGKLFQKVALARFARTLGTLIRSGVPILAALEITADACGNVVIGRALKDVQESVRHGESISGPLSKHEVFPSMVVHMIASGEETGALDDLLAKIAEFYDQEVEATTESLTALIEPLMIAFLGGVVGSMIVALYMPIFKVFDLIQ
jgi:type IV pilus assembly protein PilC